MSKIHQILTAHRQALVASLETSRSRPVVNYARTADLMTEIGECDYLMLALARRQTDEPIEDHRNDGWDDVGFVPDRQPLRAKVGAADAADRVTVRVGEAGAAERKKIYPFESVFSENFRTWAEGSSSLRRSEGERRDEDARGR